MDGVLTFGPSLSQFKIFQKTERSISALLMASEIFFSSCSFEIRLIPLQNSLLAFLFLIYRGCVTSLGQPPFPGRAPSTEGGRTFVTYFTEEGVFF